MAENAARERGPTGAFYVSDLKLDKPAQVVCTDFQRRQRRAWRVRAIIHSEYGDGTKAAPVTVYYWFIHGQLFATSGSAVHCD